MTIRAEQEFVHTSLASSTEHAPGEIRVPVALGPRSYEIRIVSGAIDSFGAFARAALDASWAGHGCRRGLIVTDENVLPLAKPFADALRAAGIASTTHVLPPGEATKHLDRAADLFDRLVDLRADRHFAIFAIGGGVIGDLAGFVAATYTRGIPLLMVPTSLLAQVDSSVGGKVGVNHHRVKNMIGAFHQPVGVWIDTDSLASLPPREFRCGLAEVVKYGVILDHAFFEWLENNVDAILNREPAAIRTIVARSCELKATVVSQDEREETGLRAVLNFGHTVGHAIEATAMPVGSVPHGEAVAAGMAAEARIAQCLGWIGSEATERIVGLVSRFGLPTSAAQFDCAKLLEAMTRDKKNKGGTIRFVLPRAIGRVELSDTADDASLAAALKA
jgi:3-dehydroquinate synthase